jgi:hypothetical protein
MVRLPLGVSIVRSKPCPFTSLLTLGAKLTPWCELGSARERVGSAGIPSAQDLGYLGGELASSLADCRALVAGPTDGGRRPKALSSAVGRRSDTRCLILFAWTLLPSFRTRLRTRLRTLLRTPSGRSPATLSRRL